MGGNHALDGWLIRQVGSPSSVEGISVADRWRVSRRLACAGTRQREQEACCK